MLLAVLVLRLDPAAVRPIMELVQQRTKAKIERFEEPRPRDL
jgi:hypothetical protein